MLKLQVKQEQDKKLNVDVEEDLKIRMLRISNIMAGVLLGSLSLIAYESHFLKQYILDEDKKLLYISAISYMYSLFSLEDKKR